MRIMNPLIEETLRSNNGVVTTAQVESLGFSRQTLVEYVTAGILERVRQGTYILPDVVEDDMYTMMLRSSSIIFSHSTALFLNGLADRTPFIHTITMPSNKMVPRSIRDECVCFYIKPQLHGVGLVERPTTFGNMVRCYDAERTVCDFLRTRDRCDEETVLAAIKNYAASTNRNLPRLAEYAKLFKVDADLRKYMEVLS